MRIWKSCSCCNTRRVVEMDDKAYVRWMHGEYIQDVAPELSVDDRELLISGICGECFDKMFGEEEEV